jgi:uncharacterized protein DUF4048
MLALASRRYAAARPPGADGGGEKLGEARLQLLTTATTLKKLPDFCTANPPSSSLVPASEVRLAFHTLSKSSIRAALVKVHVDHRLALMLAVPWRSRAFTVATVGFGAGLLCVARLFLPTIRVYAIFLHQGLARVLLGATATMPSAFLIAEQSSPPKTPKKNLLILDDRGELSSVEEEEDNPYYDSLDEEERDIMTDESPIPTHLSSRRQTLANPLRVNTGLDFADTAGPMGPMPVERIGFSPTRSSAPLHQSSFPENPSPLRGRSQPGTHSKRLSLHFPIQPPPQRSSRPPSWHTSPVFSQELLKSPTEGNFLTVLAAQERRVLELKDELRRAEEDLSRLKNQWAQHEMSRKQQSARRVLPLQPLRTNFSSLEGSEDELDEPQQVLQREMDRRKALLGSARSSGRKVFSGSRHTRALSLLSPDKGTVSAPFQSDNLRKKLNPPFHPRTPIERSSTSPNMRMNTSRNGDIFTDITGVPSETLLTAGKQMMGDMKDTFWTFVGDIKQATVGSEAIHGHGQNRAPRLHTRSKSYRQPGTFERNRRLQNSTRDLVTSQPRSKQSSMTYDQAATDISSSFWREHGILESPQAGLRRSAEASKRITRLPSNSTLNTPSKPSKDNTDDTWESWGTPTPGHKSSPAKPRTDSTSSCSSDQHRSAESSNVSSPESPTQLLTPQSSAAASDSWPPLIAKIAPEGIKTTALGLMADWERAVARPGDDEDDQGTVDVKMMKAD